jgi:hypothetical protein
MSYNNPCTDHGHEYDTKVCQNCKTDFCYTCCGWTNVDQGGKYEEDRMDCPKCGHDWYEKEETEPVKTSQEFAEHVINLAINEGAKEARAIGKALTWQSNYKVFGSKIMFADGSICELTELKKEIQEVEKRTRIQDAKAKFIKYGWIEIAKPLGCCSRIQDHNGAGVNYGKVYIEKASGKGYNRYTTDDEYDFPEWKPCKDWEALIDKFSDWL